LVSSADVVLTRTSEAVFEHSYNYLQRNSDNSTTTIMTSTTKQYSSVQLQNLCIRGFS